MKEMVRHDVLGLRAGELVEVSSEDEILATLDERGELDGLPFMPEMLQFCGRRFRVAKQAFKLCDTINGGGMHRMEQRRPPRGGALRRPGPWRLPGGLPALLEGGVAQAGPRRRSGQRARRRPATASSPAGACRC